MKKLLQLGLAVGLALASCKSIDKREHHVLAYDAQLDGSTIVRIDTNEDGIEDTTVTHKRAGEGDYRRLDWRERGRNLSYEVCTQGMGWNRLAEMNSPRKTIIFVNKREGDDYRNAKERLDFWTDKLHLYALGRETEKFLARFNSNK